MSEKVVEEELKSAELASVKVFSSVAKVVDNCVSILSTTELRSIEDALSSSLIVTVIVFFGKTTFPSEPEAILNP